MKKILTVILSMVLSINLVQATEQIPDLLIIGNDTICLKSFPLEELNFKIRPFRYGNYDFPHTACWRGYQATWKVIDDKLFLIGIIKVDSTNENLDLERFFEANNYTPHTINGLIHANWYSAEFEPVPKYLGKKGCFYEAFNPKKSNIIFKFENGEMTENRYRKRKLMPFFNRPHRANSNN